jgi:peptidoglycan/LPS O-acetylase OafA/YrhL
MTYRPEIDGLRAVAVISVVLFHARFPLPGGFLGVDTFFVISGYLITSIILKDGDRFSLARFYERRARRILPALLLVLLSTSVAAMLVLPPAPLGDFGNSLLAGMFFVANVYFWLNTDYFSEPGELSPLLHIWSLSVEEQFYVAFPLVLLLLRKLGPGALGPCLAALAGSSLLWAMLRSGSDVAATFYLVHLRAWELLVGAGLAGLELRFGRRPMPLVAVAGLVLIIGAALFLGRRHALIGSAVTTAGAAMIIACGGNGPAARLLASPPMVFIGLISYSLYLWHQPLFAFARAYAIDAPARATYVALIASSVVLAALSWKYVEQPFRNRVGRRRFLVSTSAAASVSVAFALAVLVTGGLPGRYSSEELAILEASPERGVAVRDGRPCRREIDDACIIGAGTATPTFAVLGDSHAETLTEPLAQALEAHGAAALVFTVSGCPFAANAVGAGPAARCRTRTQAVLEQVRARGIGSVIVHDRSAAYIFGTFDNGEGGVEPHRLEVFSVAGFSGAEAKRVEALYADVKSTISRLLDDGLAVYHVLPVPEAGWHVPRTLVKSIVRGRLPLTTSLDRYVERSGGSLAIAEELSARPNYFPIYPHKLLCAEGRCVTHRDRKVLYTDTDHLSREGAQIVVDAIASLLRTSARTQ